MLHGVMDTSNASLLGFYIAFNNTGEACIAGVVDTGGTVVKTITACQSLQTTFSKKEIEIGP